MAAYAYARMLTGELMPDVFAVSRTVPTARVEDVLSLPESIDVPSRLA